jgi:hypothetical protein
MSDSAIETDTKKYKEVAAAQKNLPKNMNYEQKNTHKTILKH